MLSITKRLRRSLEYSSVTSVHGVRATEREVLTRDDSLNGSRSAGPCPLARRHPLMADAGSYGLVVTLDARPLVYGGLLGTFGLWVVGCNR